MQSTSSSHVKSRIDLCRGKDGRLSILLVEDDEEARNILSDVLTIKFPQIPIYTANNGKTGLEHFSQHFPDIVVTDINMPEIDGIRMAREIKSIKPDVRLIVLTAYSDKTVLEASVAAGIDIDYYILKPVDYAALFTAIEECLALVALNHAASTLQRNDDEKT